MILIFKWLEAIFFTFAWPFVDVSVTELDIENRSNCVSLWVLSLSMLLNELKLHTWGGHLSVLSAVIVPIAMAVDAWRGDRIQASRALRSEVVRPPPESVEIELELNPMGQKSNLPSPRKCVPVLEPKDTNIGNRHFFETPEQKRNRLKRMADGHMHAAPDKQGVPRI